MAPRLLSSSSITGTQVKNRSGKSLGEIKDLMLNTNKGNIAYAVLSFGGLFGIGDKLFAIPFKAFSIDTEDHAFILNVDKEKLEDAPGFDKDDWPSHANSAYLNRVYSYYEQTPNW